MSKIGLSENDIASAFLAACRFDVLSLKPGNVSIDRSGHDMVADQFLSAAREAAPKIALCTSVGSGIRESVSVSVAAAGCNVNLGIILLCVPLALAAKSPNSSWDLRDRLAQILDDLSVGDARDAFSGIRIAEPGGLGEVEDHDVNDEPRVDLRTAMSYAADHDRIALQYDRRFVDIFTLGVPVLRHFVDAWGSFRWATVACYLTFLAGIDDSHIVRKFGSGAAAGVRSQANQLERVFKACENPAKFSESLMRFDEELKNGDLNPGTSADLTVASVMAHLLQCQLQR